MNDNDQSAGRESNAAIPVDERPSKGLSGDKTKRKPPVSGDKLTEQPYGQGRPTPSE